MHLGRVRFVVVAVSMALVVHGLARACGVLLACSSRQPLFLSAAVNEIAGK